MTQKQPQMPLNNRYNSWLFVGVLIVCFTVSAGVRYQQFETWKKNPTAYFVGDRPMMTTLDAPYWLRLAKLFNERTYGQKNNLRSFPENEEYYQNKIQKNSSIPLRYKDPNTVSSSSHSSSSGIPEFSYRDVPLLSFLIAHLVPFFNYNYYLTGTLMVPVFSSLFIFPLGIYFYRIGVPGSGILGGLIGTFAGGYYMRSSIGRIDTDMLNLFFPLLSGLMILLAVRAKTERSILICALSAGFSMFLFQWWYNRPGFILVFFMLLVFSFFIHRIRFRTILLSSILFVLFSNPVNFFKAADSIKVFYNNYFEINVARKANIDDLTNPTNFPNTMTTISEVDQLSKDEVFRRVLSNPLIAKIGLISFLALALFRWRVLLPLLPMLFLGLMSFKSSNRFIMYFAPFVGVGLGFMLQLLFEAIFLFVSNFYYSLKKDVKAELSKVKNDTLNDKYSLWEKIFNWLSKSEDENVLAINFVERKETVRNKSKKEQRQKGGEGANVYWWNWTCQVVLYLVLGVFFWLISVQTAISFVPGPSINTGVYKTFLEVKKRVPGNSVLLTWWDYGYALLDATELAIFHDGGSQTTPKTYFVARSLISSDPIELYTITQFLATEGIVGLERYNISPEALLEAVNNPKNKPFNPIYLFFTGDMTGKYGAISKLGSWDIYKGGGKPRGYQHLACNKMTSQEMKCRGANINLKDGFINNQLALSRLIFLRDGKVLREKKFGHSHGYTLQLILIGNKIVEVQLIDEAVFQSNYNQMFLLGAYQKDLFEEVYNAYPFSRLYKIKF